MVWQSPKFPSRNFWYAWNILNFGISQLFDWRVSGREHIPTRGPLLVASNHIALLDPPYVGASLTREACFVAKKELFAFAPLGAFISSFNSIPIRRGGWDSGAIRSVRRKLEQGWPVIMFPEGTRSRIGDFLPAKPGVGMMARQCRVPVVPAYIEGTNRDLPTLLAKRRPLISAFGPAMPVEEVCRYPDNKRGYQELSLAIMDRIKAVRDSL